MTTKQAKQTVVAINNRQYPVPQKTEMFQLNRMNTKFNKKLNDKPLGKLYASTCI